jgi:cytidylate kinase
MPSSSVVLTVSRQLAAGGAFIGQGVARRLGLRYVDRELLTQAAAALGVEDERSLETIEERVATLWPRVARALFVGAPDTPFVPPPPPVRESDVHAVQTRLIRELADEGNVVIVGRGAPHVLGDRPGVVRVFVHAPKERRIVELQRLYGVSPAEARRMLEQSDRDRAKFVESMTGRSWTDACLYDLTVDTSVIPIELATDLIVSVLRARMEPQAGTQTPQA